MGLLLAESVAVLSAEVNFMYFGQVHNICMLIKYAPIGHLETSYAAVTSFFWIIPPCQILSNACETSRKSEGNFVITVHKWLI